MAARLTPLGAVIKGVVAGALGTLAMDVVWYRRYQKGGGEDSFPAWELAAGTTSYETADAPAQAGKRLIEGLFDTKLPDKSAGVMTNAVHWATGLGWGAFHGILFGGSSSVKQPLLGPFTGVVAWLAGYAVLAPAKLYKPMWQYDAQTLWKDLSAHLVYGSVTGAAFGLLTTGKKA